MADSKFTSRLFSVTEKSKQVRTKAPGAAGKIPYTPEMLLNEPSGNLFGLSLNTGMGVEPGKSCRPNVMIVSTSGGRFNQQGKLAA